jgi:ABC-type transporter Mla subunit MlaD
MGPIPLRALLATALLAVGLLAGGCSGGDDPTRFTAVFDNATNLFVGSEVRVLGLEVGQVTAIAPRGEVVEVEMAVDADQPLALSHDVILAVLLPTFPSGTNSE